MIGILERELNNSVEEAIAIGISEHIIRSVNYCKREEDTEKSIQEKVQKCSQDLKKINITMLLRLKELRNNTKEIKELN